MIGSVVSMCRIPVLVLSIATVACGSSRSDETLDSAAVEFLRQTCLDCHDGVDGEAGFDLNTLLDPIANPSVVDLPVDRWVRVYDRVSTGEMPPAESIDGGPPGLDVEAKNHFLDRAGRMIEHAESEQYRSAGRVPSRRLTNDQLQWTLCDLLAIDLPLSDLMPDEPRTDGFRNIAAAQAMSHYHLNDHLRVVDVALDYAFARIDPDLSGDTLTLPATQIANKLPGQRNRDPELRQGAAVTWSGGVSFYGRISNSRVRRSGWYEITLDASALKMPAGRGLWCSVRSGQCVSSAPLMNWIGSFEATETPASFSFTAWLNEGDMLEIRPADETLKKAKFSGGQVGFGEAEPQNVPGVAMHSLSLQQVYPGGDRDAVREALLGSLKVVPEDASGKYVLESHTPARDLNKQVRRFADAAFRAPVPAESLQPYLQMIRDSIRAGQDPITSLRECYRAILCSPRFIYFSESPGPLDDHALANRLSYLLTGRPPDRDLRRAADEGTLRDPPTIIQHTRRLLAGDSIRHFVNDFADQWLDLTDIDFTEPDRRLFPDFDLIVQDSMLQETRRYLTTLIQENQPAQLLIDSDFTWLNNRLARYYDLPAAIEPSQWQRVSIADHPHRGGLMTHGSILKVTANGSNTSPVVRGVWICDRLLGIPIPDPPANVPAIEPDVRGATTIRQILEKHRSQVECASCHSKIDPPGFALEHFDAAGRWRDHYFTRENKSSSKAAKVDAAYQMADGRPFDSFTAFRELAAADDRMVARNFAAKLLVYATGKEITYTDRQSLDQIASVTEADGYRLRSVIEAVVTSPTFLNK